MNKSEQATKLLKHAAVLAKGDRLQGLYRLIDGQKTISTKKVLAEIERVENALKDDAVMVRGVVAAINEPSEPRSELPAGILEGFLFSIGQKVFFDGLVDNPQYNGLEVVIAGFRPCSVCIHCPSGRAYYLEGGTPWGNHWVYEERLTDKPSDQGGNK